MNFSNNNKSEKLKICNILVKLSTNNLNKLRFQKNV